jgi:hydrogenase maturation protease
LYDYADVSPESSGDFFDGTEIDEMLALRVQTMTDGEKREMRSVDARARKILERVESFSDEQLLRLHGATRPQSASTP